MTGDPIEALLQVVEALEELGIPYAIGGSVASSVHGEPRTSADADVLVALDMTLLGQLIARLGAGFYVPENAAQDAVRLRTSFNVLHLGSMYKVDLFVAGPGPLDREQLRRRTPLVIMAGGATRPVQMTAPENLILRKLDWYRRGGGVSDRQWRDVLGMLKVQGSRLDRDYLADLAEQAGLRALLEKALAEAGLPLV